MGPVACVPYGLNLANHFMTLTYVLAYDKSGEASATIVR